MIATPHWDYYEEDFAQADQLLRCGAMGGMPPEVAAAVRRGDIVVVRFEGPELTARKGEALATGAELVAEIIRGCRSRAGGGTLG